MALPCVRMGAVRLRYGALYRLLCRSSSHQASAAATEEIEIPRKKTWDKTAVLQALAYTVNHDPTMIHYSFQDDPYLLPKSSIDYSLFNISKTSGKNAAKYILNMHPNLFEKDTAEPHIPLLMPENVQPLIEGISEEALSERIQLRRLKQSVDLYDQLLQAGTPPSLETTNRLLDLLCFYGNQEPVQNNRSTFLEMEADPRQADNLPAAKNWRHRNDADRIFRLMSEKDDHSYRAMIQGMVKHGAVRKAFDMYTDLLNNRMTGDVNTFNALIRGIPAIKIEATEKWDAIVDLLKHMDQQKVQPNLHTFNAVLSSLKKTGLKKMAIQTIQEMRALNIEPSLATFSHLLAVFFKSSLLAAHSVLESILQSIKGRSFTVQDPDDVKFFVDAMRVCVDAKDLQMAYELENLKNTGDNWKLLGNKSIRTVYYGRFFSLVCSLENIDELMKWYRQLIPSHYFSNTFNMEHVLQVVEMENRLELVPQLWKDVYFIGHSNKENLIQMFLNVMTKEKPEPELQSQFGDIAASMKTLFEPSEEFTPKMKLSAPILGGIVLLLCRSGRMEEAWKMLKDFKSNNLVPGPDVMQKLLDCVKASGNTSMAMDVVQLAISFSLPNTPQLAKTVLDEFTVNEQQRRTLQELTPDSDSSSSDSDSDHE